MLLGNEVFSVDIIRTDFVLDSNLILQNSVFGYLVRGSVRDFEENKTHSGLIAEMEMENLNNDLQKFWETEEVSEKSIIKNPNEIECSKHFSET